MPNSYTTITLLSGSSGTNASGQTVYGPFDFDYINTSDIKAVVKVTSGSTFKWQSATVASVDAATKLVTLSENLSFSDVLDQMRIYRETSLSSLVDFQSGSRISEADLDTAYRQALFVAQETAEDGSGSGTRTLQTADDIASGAITAAELATDAVETVKIKNLNVDATKLAANAVIEDKILNGAVTATKLDTDAVIAAKIKDGEVTAPKLASTLDLSTKTLTFPASSLAGKTDMEGEVVNGKTCIASTLKHHPGIAKAYGRILLSGTGTGHGVLEAGDYNVDSVAPSTSTSTDGDPDFTRVTLSSAMADTNYVVTATQQQLDSATSTYATASYGVTVNIISTTQFDVGTNVDGDSIAFVVHGKLA